MCLVTKAEFSKWRDRCSDVFGSECLLLSFVDLNVILNRNVNEFCLMASKDDVDNRVKLTEAYLKICKVRELQLQNLTHRI